MGTGRLDLSGRLNSVWVEPPEDISYRRSGEKVAGIDFIDENGGGPGVRLWQRPGEKALEVVLRIDPSGTIATQGTLFICRPLGIAGGQDHMMIK
jgi:hypothetical protein